MQDIELIDSVIKACSDESVQEQIESICKAASDVMMEFYGYSLFTSNQFRVIATFEGKKADEEFGESEAKIRAADAPPFEAIAEWICDEVSDPLAITDIANLESRPTLDDFQREITFFTRYSNGEDSEENPPSPEEVDVMETAALLLSEAGIRMLFLIRQDVWDCEQ
jgi:hypothetical protein